MASSTAVREIELSQHQIDFLACPALYKALVAGIGSGKSWVGSYDMIRRAKPGRLYMVVGPTYPLLNDATFRSFLKVADDDLGLIHAGGNQVKRSAPPSIKLPTGAEILFRTGDDPEHLRGPNLSGIWLDEASLMKEEVFKICIGRLRQEGEAGWLTATFTPKGRRHWTYKVFATDKPNTAMFRAKTRDNPFNPPGFENMLREQYTERERQQELEGLFLEEGGGHFKPSLWPRAEFTSDAVAIGQRPRREVLRHELLTVLVAIDIATSQKDTSDHTAFVAAGLTRDGRLIIFEVVNERLNLENVGRRLDGFCERWKPYVVAGDDDNLSKAMLLEYRRWPHIPEVRCLPIKGRAKILRAQSAIIMGENGRIHLPDSAPWLDDYQDQLAAFTGIVKGEEDDMVDCTGILARLAMLLKPARRPAPMMEILTLGRQF